MGFPHVMLLKQGERGQDGNSIVGPPGPPGPPGPIIAIPEVSAFVKLQSLCNSA